MRRTVLTLTLAAAALALAACSTAPAVAPTPVATPAPAPTLAEQLLEIRKAELELERTEQMAWLKFAAESGSDIVKGFVMGRGAAKPAAASSSTAQTVIAAQAQQDATALRREELAEGRSWWNRGLQIVDRVTPLWMFSKQQSFARYQLDQANTQNRYTLDTLRGAQLDGFRLGGQTTLGGVSAGSSATLGGLSAGAAAAAAGAAPFAPAAGPEAAPETPAE
jgi:hypothetical protein